MSLERTPVTDGQIITLADRSPLRVTPPEQMVDAYLTGGLEAALMGEALAWDPALRQYLTHLASLLSDWLPSQTRLNASLFEDCLDDAATAWGLARQRGSSPDAQWLYWMRGLLVSLPVLQQWSIQGVRQSQVVEWDPLPPPQQLSHLAHRAINPLSRWIESLEGGLHLERGFRGTPPPWALFESTGFRAQLAWEYLWIGEGRHRLLRSWDNIDFIVGRRSAPPVGADQ